jgi:4-hydroxy-4-methyl-2-oxoglutarate aldolase
MGSNTDDIRTALESFGAATIFEAAGEAGRWLPGIRPLWPGAVMAGRTRTAAVPAGDNLGVHKAIGTCEEGDVVVVAAGGDTTVALAGEILIAAAMVRGARGVVVDGAVRDVAALRRLGLPVFAAGISPAGPEKTRSGELGVSVRIGGETVESGDWIVGDDDGVVVFAAGRLQDVVERAAWRTEHEVRVLRLVRNGIPTLEALRSDREKP